jgi:large subunit ribosomal protein L28
MSRQCSLNEKKSVLVGHQVSHSNIKTKKRFLPNLQVVSFLSDALGKVIKLRVATNTIRSIDHNDGIDNYLLKTSGSKLSPEARKLKKEIRLASPKSSKPATPKKKTAAPKKKKAKKAVA